MAGKKFSRLHTSEPIAKGVKILDEEPSDAAHGRLLLRSALETAWANPGRWIEVQFSGEDEVARIRPAFAAILGSGNAKRRESALYIRAEHAGE